MADGLITLRWLFSSDGASFTELTNVVFTEDFSSFLQAASGTFANGGDDPSPGAFRSASAEFCQ